MIATAIIAAATQWMTTQNGGHHRVFAHKVATMLPKVLEPVAVGNPARLDGCARQLLAT